MKLHLDQDSFESLISLTSKFIGIPDMAIRRDYLIVMLLQNLQHSEFAELVVFKGGTSLSKCYPGSISRFSEDIDLTYIPNSQMSEKQYSKSLKQIESAIIGDAFHEKIGAMRNNRNKCALVWLFEDYKDSSKIKIEIGSSIKPDPYEKRKLKSYIQDYLESQNMLDVIAEYDLEEVQLNVLCVSRTFIDKIFAVKRHAICGSLSEKVRHIYDVTKLFDLPEIQSFLTDKHALKEIVAKTKETDSYYLEKLDMYNNYDSTCAYDFNSWQANFDNAIKARYESLHIDLLYTNKKQSFSKAVETFGEISRLLSEIGE